MDAEVIPTDEVTSSGEVQTTDAPATQDETQSTDVRATGDTANPQTSPDSTTESAPASFDADLDEWATKTGRQLPQTDNERKSYQEIRDSQREYSKQQAALKSQAEMDTTISTMGSDMPTAEYADPLETKFEAMQAEMRAERNTRLRSEYILTNNVSEEEVKVMQDILREKVERAKSVSDDKARTVFDYLTDPDNLADWHTQAKARLTSTMDTSRIEETAALRERERIAKEQQATSGPRGASRTVIEEKSLEQERLERFKQPW